MGWLAWWRQRRDREQDLADEIRSHLDAETRLRVTRGQQADDARAGATRDFGNVLDVAETTRGMWGWSPAAFVDDTRHAFRRLRAKPSAALTAAGMLALGIGLATAMFTLVDALVLSPAPFRDPDCLARLWWLAGNSGRSTVAPAVLLTFRSSPVFAGAEGAISAVSILDGDGGPLVKGSARVSPGILDLLGVRPVLGRAFAPTEGTAGNDGVVLLSEDVWRSALGGDPRILGRQLILDGDRVEVVGLMPSGFRFPDWDTVIWRPSDFQARPSARAADMPTAFVRFAPGVPLAEALAAATTMARRVDPSMPPKAVFKTRAMSGTDLDPYYLHAVPILSAGVALVFLVLCANVSSLLLARLTARAAEFRMCAALGASRARLLREALVEHAAIGLGAAGLGVGLAFGLVVVARAFLPQAFLARTLHVVTLDGRALAVAVGAALAAAVTAGLAPAWIATRASSSQSAISTRGGTTSRAASRWTRGLLVLELTLASTLLVLATLLVRSFVNLTSIDRGLDSHGVLTVWVGPPPNLSADRSARTVLAATTVDALRSLPGVDAVALSQGLPPNGWTNYLQDAFQPSDPGATPVRISRVDNYGVGPDFFRLYRIPIVDGRAFEPADDSGAAIVGERLGHLLWPNGSAVGRSFTCCGIPTAFHVVGVARELRFPTVDTFRDAPQFYSPFTAGASASDINIRCAGTCPSEAVIRRQIFRAVPGTRIYGFNVLDNTYQESLGRPRGAAALGSTFAAIAVLAAAGGLFSVLTYAVGRRRREFGVRIALGASPSDLQRLVLRDGLRVAGIGIVIGTAASLALARVIAAMEYGVSRFDPVTYAIVLGVLLVTTLLASWRPARRAMTVDPAELLRDE